MNLSAICHKSDPFLIDPVILLFYSFHAVGQKLQTYLTCKHKSQVLIFHSDKLVAGMLFFSYMVEDKAAGPGSLSYVEFLVHVHRQIQTKMT